VVTTSAGGARADNPNRGDADLVDVPIPGEAGWGDEVTAVAPPSQPSARVGNAVLPYASPGVQRPLSTSKLLNVFIAGYAAVIVLVLFYLSIPSPAPRRGMADLIATVQSLRSNVALFKLQHNDRLPGVCPLVEGGGLFSANEATFWAQMTQFTDLNGNTSPTKTERYCFGPYILPGYDNALNRSKTIASAPAPGVGFVYDFAGGAGSGKVWGVDRSGALVQQ
jgi:hypothetical protein